MRQSDCIDMCCLHQLEVTLHQFLGHDTGSIGVVLVTVDAANLDGLAVDKQLSAGNANITETHL